MPTSCGKKHFKKNDDLQISIYGEICGLSEGGRLLPILNDHKCKQFQSLEWQRVCYDLVSKYSLMFFVFGFRIYTDGIV